MSPTTILHGRHELEAVLAGCPELHMRAPSGVRPAAEERDPELEQALETVLPLETAFDPMGRRPNAKPVSSLQHPERSNEKERSRGQPFERVNTPATKRLAALELRMRPSAKADDLTGSTRARMAAGCPRRPFTSR
jgi:hypothetical protein